ncbi:MAG: YibE/F family protein [Chloroflexi bacterium]|nr:YibE/F family protein [Chloroflexota bacterium]
MFNDARKLRMLAATLFVALIMVIALLLVVWTQLQASPRAMEEDAETLQARVVRVIDTRSVEVAPNQTQPVQRVEIELASGAQSSTRLEAEYGASSDDLLLRAGDNVLVMAIQQANGEMALTITDLVRTGALAFLAAGFVLFAILVSGWKGVRALIGLAFSFVVLLGFVLPQIFAGSDPVLISVAGSFLLLAVTLYLTQGWSLKTHASLAGVFVSLLLTGMLAAFAINFARLSGFGAEEAVFLQSANVAINVRGLLLAGIIVGTLGVLDDVIVSQASAVMELADANPALGWRELYRRAMNIGHDHIAATINTLVLAYIGAAMPMWMLFQVYPEPWSFTLNRELIAEEIVRTLVGSLGLISAVPITTLIASVLRAKTQRV